MANSKPEQLFRKNSAGEMEEVPPVTCTLIHNNGKGFKVCGGVISKTKIHKPFDDHTPIGGSYRSPLIDSFGSCQKCHVRYDDDVFIPMKNGKPVKLYRRISAHREEELRTMIESALRTSDAVSGGKEKGKFSVDDLMKDRLYVAVN